MKYLAIKPDKGGIPAIDNNEIVIETANKGLVLPKPLNDEMFIEPVFSDTKYKTINATIVATE